MVAILYPRRLRNQLDVTQPGGIGLPDAGVPVLHSSNSFFVIETIGGGTGGGSFSLGASTIGNTLGATGVTGSRVVLAGIGNITLSQATDGNGGTISISGAGGAQTVQTQDRFNLTLNGNTAGVLQQVSSGTLSLAGGNGITLSQAGNAITISGNTFTQSVQPETQTFLGGLAASNTTYTSGTVTLSGVGGGVTVSSNTGQRIDISVAAPVAQTVQTQSRFNLTISGNTAGAGALISSGVMTLAGGNNITVSQAGNAITLSGAAAGGAQTAISGIIASDATYTSGTVQFTGSNMVTVRSSANQRVVIDATQSVQPGIQNLVASNTTFSSGTVSISGFGAVTVNTAANIIRISAPVQTAQTGVSGIANSQTTYTSGTVSMSELGAITIRSTTGNQFQFSVNSQTVQTQNMVAVTLSGNTSGAQALVSSGTLTLAGGNNITVSQAGNAVTISGANVGGAQTGISSIVASDATYTSGSVQFTGSGIVTIRSSANQRVVVDASQSVQPGVQQLVVSNTTFSSGTVSISGFGDVTVNTAANIIRISAPVQTAETAISGLANSQTTYTSGTVSLSDLANITIRSTTGNQFQFSVAAQSTQPGVQHFVVSNTTFSSGTVSISGFGDVTVNTAANIIRISAPVQTAQTGISGLANSQTTYTSGTVSMSELGAITIRSTTGNQYQFSVNAQSVQPETQTFLGGVSLSGNTAGVMALISSGTLNLAGGNNITLSQNGQSVTISGGAGGGFSAGVSTGGATAGDTGVTGSRLVFVGTNNITLSQATAAAGGTVTISGPTTVAQTVQPGIQHLVASNTTFSSGTVSISGFGDVTVNTAANIIRISAPTQTVQPGVQHLVASDNTFSSGTVSITGTGGGVTVNTAASKIQISVAAPVAQSTQPGVQHFVVSNTTFSSGTVSISGFGDVTVNTAANIIRISAPTQTTQPGVQHLVASDNTFSSGTVSITGTGGGVTVNTAASKIQISVAAPVAQTGTQFSAGLSNIGNTIGDTVTVAGRLVLAGGNNITLSGSSNGASQTITISAPNLGAGAMSAGVSNIGNSAGATGITGTQLVLVGSNNITLSQTTGANGGTVSIIGGGGGGFSAGVSTGGNTAGATGISGTQMVLVGSGAMSLSQTTGANGNTVSILAPATSSIVGVRPISISTAGSTISIDYYDSKADWQNFPRMQASLLSHVSGFSKTPIYWQDHVDGDVLAKSLAFAISMVTASQPLSVSAHLGVYTLVNSTSAALLGSVSEAYVISSATSVSLSGVRNVIMTALGTHTALSSITGGEYAFGMMFSGTATQVMNFSILGASGGPAPLGGLYPGTNQFSAGTSQGIQALRGRGSTTVNAMPANFVASELVNQGSGASAALQPWIYIRS